MKKLFAPVLALVLLLSLAACGSAPAESGEEALSRSLPGETAGEESPEGTPPSASGETAPEPSDLDLDLSLCRSEEVFREIEHMNIDPRGYAGMRLRLKGEASHFESHDKTIWYVGVRDEDGCIENLELRFPGDGGAPADFPGDGAPILVWGRVETYEVLRGDERVLCPVLTDAHFTTLPDSRD